MPVVGRLFLSLVPLLMWGSCTAPEDLAQRYFDAGPLTVTVLGPDGKAAPGVEVILHGPHGEVLSQQQADPTGHVRWDVTGQSSVTAIWDAATGADLRSIVDVGAGSVTLRFDRVGMLKREATSHGVMQFEFSDAFPGATYYTIGNGCVEDLVTDITVPTLQEVNSSCLAPGDEISVIGIARDANDVPLGYAVARDIPFVADTIVTLGTWQSNFSTVELELTNVPVDAATIGASLGVSRETAFYELSQAHGDASSELTSKLFAVTGVGIYRIMVGAYNYSSTTSLVKGMSTLPKSLSVDLNQELLPPISEVVLSGDAPSDMSLTWTEDALLAEVDAFTATFAWVDAEGAPYAWNVLGSARMTGEFVLPSLPEDFAGWFAGASQLGVSGIGFYDDAAAADFAEFHAKRNERVENPIFEMRSVIAY